jgi:hypothetical protein
MRRMDFALAGSLEELKAKGGSLCMGATVRSSLSTTAGTCSPEGSDERFEKLANMLVTMGMRGQPRIYHANVVIALSLQL